jgi:hypothetical protein
MKRAISLSFLLLANIILLAHVLIPCQHDHDTIICSCLPADHCETHDTGNQQHGEDCPMEESPMDVDLYVRHTNINSVNDFCLNGAVHYPMLFLVSNNPIVEINDPKDLPMWQTPYMLTCHTDYISHSLGLRAPPAC